VLHDKSHRLQTVSRTSTQMHYVCKNYDTNMRTSSQVSYPAVLRLTTINLTLLYFFISLCNTQPTIYLSYFVFMATSVSRECDCWGKIFIENPCSGETMRPVQRNYKETPKCVSKMPPFCRSDILMIDGFPYALLGQIQSE
jgi:hypothetical protein